MHNAVIEKAPKVLRELILCIDKNCERVYIEISKY